MSETYYQKFDVVWFEVVDQGGLLIRGLMEYCKMMHINPLISIPLDRSWVGGFFESDAALISNYLQVNKIFEEGA